MIFILESESVDTRYQGIRWHQILSV